MEKGSSSLEPERVARIDDQQTELPESYHASLMLPWKTLVVLCGPAGAGKSTFARRLIDQHRGQGYRLTSMVSSDYCRALICDDENNQGVNRDTFELFYFLIQKRLSLGYATIADSTALHESARLALLRIARQFQFQTCLLVFNMSLETCMRNDQNQARGRVVGENVITYHLNLLRQALKSIPQEGWDSIALIDEAHWNMPITLLPR